MEDQDRKKVILTLRWTAIIVTSYLILFGRGQGDRPPSKSHPYCCIYLIKCFTHLPSKEHGFQIQNYSIH